MMTTLKLDHLDLSSGEKERIAKACAALSNEITAAHCGTYAFGAALAQAVIQDLWREHGDTRALLLGAAQ